MEIQSRIENRRHRVVWQEVCQNLVEEKQPRKVIIFSRDELKQHEMQVGGYRHDRRYYSSDNNSEWLDVEDIQKFIALFEELFAQGKLEG